MLDLPAEHNIRAIIETINGLCLYVGSLAHFKLVVSLDALGLFRCLGEPGIMLVLLFRGEGSPGKCLPHRKRRLLLNDLS